MTTLPQHKTIDGKEGTDALFHYTAEAILVVNHLGEIIKINPSAENLFGYAKDELNGKKIEALVPQRFSSDHAGFRQNYGNDSYARPMGAGLDLYGLKKECRLNKNELQKKEFAKNIEGLSEFLHEAKGIDTLKKLSEEGDIRFYKKREDMYLSTINCPKLRIKKCDRNR